MTIEDKLFYKDKINDLLFSGDKNNITLAIELAKSLQIKLDINEYIQAYKDIEGYLDCRFDDLSRFLSTQSLFSYDDLSSIEEIPFLRNLISLNLPLTKQLPRGTFNQLNLKKLRVTNANISTIENEISNLINLESLIMVNCKFKKIPESIF